MHGWTGQILEVDLTSGNTRILRLAEDIYERFIGGRGLAGHLLSEHVTLPWDDPRMPLFFMTGPLCGTCAPTSGRMTIMSRSPLTGTVGDASVGGTLGSALKAAGLDGVCVIGRAPYALGLEIEDNSVSLVDAQSLLTHTTSELRAKVGQGRAVALTGPAAERGVRFSSIIVDGHFAAARGGIGLAMASKGLKYLAVKGTGRVSVADESQLKSAREEILRLVAASPALLGEQGIAKLGTPALYDLLHVRRMMPTANFRRTYFEAAPLLGAHALAKAYQPRRAGCQGCHILCKKIAVDGRPLPEFETLSHFTALLENPDLEVAVQANELCNELGMDTISAASTLACHLELAGAQATGEELLEMLREIGRGGVFGIGSAEHARRAGAPQTSMAVKGQELPAYDPRGAYGMALSYATSTRGGCHLRAYPISHEILRKPVATDRFSFEGKARIVKIAEDHNAVIDSLVACKFVFFGATLEEYARALGAVIGRSVATHELARVGERIVYNERMMNARNGFTADDDDLPKRFFDEPGSSGAGLEIKALDRRDFLEARRRYYTCRGLDADGRPTPEKARELELPWRD
ncbi:MAG: aldehyde ferredoxin oxidoreductase family protein [Myxococcota bacterium]|jgi:aldehyde:ferredoxin oxidoreductase|nr:aldehyde ferredoxin oxidoreductase family protein [Myxococcota bacterium]